MPRQSTIGFAKQTWLCSSLETPSAAVEVVLADDHVLDVLQRHCRALSPFS